MNIEIRKYDHSKDYHELLEVIKSEGEEWKDYLNPSYRAVLERSITYVACVDKKLCGFSRSMNDFGICLYIIDLLVDKKYRGNAIGKQLMERLSADYPNQDIYVMSDVDEYYQKLGYQKEGSLFRVE